MTMVTNIARVNSRHDSATAQTNMNINCHHPTDVWSSYVVAPFILSFRVECDSDVLRGPEMCSICLTKRLHSKYSFGSLNFMLLI